MIDLKNTHCCPFSSTGAACAHFTPIAQLTLSDSNAIACGKVQDVDGEFTVWLKDTTNASPRQAIYYKGANDACDLYDYKGRAGMRTRYH